MIGVDLYKQILDANRHRPLLIYGDPDVDGLISLKLLKDFADYLGYTEYKYVVNNNREHGFSANPDLLKGYLVISADFGITQEEMQNLVEHDIVVLGTDHHEVQDDFIHCTCGEAQGILLNNQYPFEPDEDRYLSGAGVFYELICSLYPDFKTAERDALIGITLISDVRPIENNASAKAYLRKTYSADTSVGYLHHLVADSSSGYKGGFGVPRLDNNFISFTLSPLINALLRFDMKTEAIAFILGDKLSDVSIRDTQRKVVNYMIDTAKILNLPSVHIIAIQGDLVTEKFPFVTPTNFVGAVCNRYMGSHGGVSTLGFVTQGGVVTRCSFRGRYSGVQYKMSFLQNGYNVAGHSSAFGFKEFEPTTDDWTTIQDLVADLESMHSPEHKVIETSSLIMTLSQKGQSIATENCYVREAYRTYIRYTGSNYFIRKVTYRTEEYTGSDALAGKKPDIWENGVAKVYQLDKDGNRIPKYIEYEVDGRLVKSFGTHIEDGLILPVLENGYLVLYLKEQII